MTTTKLFEKELRACGKMDFTVKPSTVYCAVYTACQVRRAHWIHRLLFSVVKRHLQSPRDCENLLREGNNASGVYEEVRPSIL